MAGVGRAPGAVDGWQLAAASGELHPRVDLAAVHLSPKKELHESLRAEYANGGRPRS